MNRNVRMEYLDKCIIKLLRIFCLAILSIDLWNIVSTQCEKGKWENFGAGCMLLTFDVLMYGKMVYMDCILSFIGCCARAYEYWFCGKYVEY